MIGEDTVLDRRGMEEIMTRDQRTTYHRVERAPAIDDTRTINSKCEKGIAGGRVCARGNRECDECGVTCSCDYGIKRLGKRWRRGTTCGNTWLRLGCLLLTLFVVSVQGAPTMTLENRRLNSPEKWMNPCGEGLPTEESDGEPEYGPLTDAELLNMVAVQAKTALNQAEGFRDNYIKQTFNTDFAVLHSEWKDNHYDWLPGPDKIPKQLGEPLAPEYLSKLGLEMLDNILLDVYEYMQTYAVGLEQIVWDHEDHRLEFLQKFKDTESSLQTVLCELQAALIERGVTPRNNISRKAMSNDYRGAMSSQATFRNLRDWLIFRDYMNALEYVVEVFGHLSRAVKS
ncbi:uncharacterized protein LOC107048455 [Diachasma alloeum]|uniref:uncharacterized protein LOC107048455 n=1 Tax=Diachasma alloeum TaxID=454923 RepID=UPI0010FB4EE8|nr:uncharacterized protein LOC107048455 [Diachasma alloeum]